MIQPNLSNLDNTDNYLLFPISNNKEYEIFIIANDSYLFPSLFQMETIGGLIVIKTKATKTKIKLNINEIVSIVTDEDYDEEYINSIKIKLLNRYPSKKHQELFVNKKYAKIFYYPKISYKECNLINLFKCSKNKKIFTEKETRVKRVMEILISAKYLNELQEELHKAISYECKANNLSNYSGSGMLISQNAFPKRKIYIIVNPHSSHYSNSILYQAINFFKCANLPFDIIHTSRKNNAKTFIQNLDFEPYDGIIACGGDGLLHEIINGIYNRKDYKDFIDKISIGILPCGKNNSFAYSIAKESNEEYKSETFSFIIAKGITKTIDIQQVELMNDNADERQYIYSLSNIAFYESASLIKDSKNPNRDHSFNSYFAYLPFCSDFDIKKIPTVNHRITGLKDMHHSKEMYSFFFASNITYMNSNTKMTSKALLNDGYCDIITMKENGNNKLSSFRSTYAHEGNYFDENDKLKNDIGIDYIKTKSFRLKIESDDPVECLIDGEEYTFKSLQVKTMKQAIKVYCFNNSK